MFVLEALVLTFITTPLVTYFYPPHLRHRIDASGANFGNVADEEGAFHKAHTPLRDGEFKTRFTVVLDKLEHVPGMMALTRLIQPAPSLISSRESNGSSAHEPRASQRINHSLVISLEALRLIELSDRVSDVMKSTMHDSFPLTDPLLSIFRIFGQLNRIHVSLALSVVKFEDLAYSVAEHARTYGSDMIMLPWLPPVRNTSDRPPPSTPIQGPIALLPTATSGGAPVKSLQSSNPFDILFCADGPPGGVDVSNSVSVIHSQFVRGVFSQATTDVALFVDQNTLDSASIVGGMQQQHIFLPFFGGPDDRLALEFVVQICANPGMRGTVVRITKCDVGGIAVLPTHINSHRHDEGHDEGQNTEENTSTVGSVCRSFTPRFGFLNNVPLLAQRINGVSDAVYGQQGVDTRLQSEIADNIIWARYAKSPMASNTDRKSIHSTASSSARPQIEFKSLSTPLPLHAAIQEATSVIYPTTTKLIVVTGRSRRLAVKNHRRELKELMNKHEYVGEEVRGTIGDVGTAFVVAGVGSGVVVLQAAGMGNLD